MGQDRPSAPGLILVEEESFQKEAFDGAIINTPMTHQGGLADLRGLTADAAALKDRCRMCRNGMLDTRRHLTN